MLFNIAIYKQPWTGEDIENGEPSLPTNESIEVVDFTSLYHTVKDFSYAVNGAPRCWLVDSYDDWSEGGVHIEKTLHLLDNEPRAIRYWYKAIRMSGVTTDPHFFNN